MKKGETIVKRPIKCNSEDLRDYDVTVTFASFVGSDEVYSVFAKDEDDAANDALEQARADLSDLDVNQIDDGEWEVEIGFAGFIGVSETYTVYADDEDEAINDAYEMAADDLEVTDVSLA